MARNHGRVLASIWTDGDFRALPPDPQRLYLFLLSQPNLNHAGLIPLTLRRWAGAADGLTVDDVRAALRRLEADRFVVVDEDREEVLVRSLVRRDGIWKQPKVMLSMEGDAQEISSPQLRAALVAELGRLDLGALSDEPTKTGESNRAVVRGVIERLRVAFAEAIGGVSDTPSDTPPDTHRVADAEGTGNPHAGAGAHSPAPTPSPTPVPPTAGADAPPLRAVEDWKPATTDELIADWLDHIPKRPPGSVIGQVGKHIKAMLAEGVDPADIRRGIAAWSSRGLHPSSLPSVVNEVMNSTPRTQRAPVNGRAVGHGDSGPFLPQQDYSNVRI